MSLQLAVVTAVIYSSLVAFMVLYVSDGPSALGGWRVAVSGDTVTTGATGLPELVQSVAQDAQSVVIRQVNDLNDRSTQHLYVVDGDSGRGEASWATQGYPWFSAATNWRTDNGDGLTGQDPRGVYYVFGTGESAKVVADRFRDLGYEASLTPPTSMAQVVTGVFFGALGTSTMVFVLLAGLLIGTGVIAKTKAYAIMRLHGASQTRAMAEDLKALSPTFVVAPAAIGAAGLVGLMSYNHLHQSGRFLVVAGAILLVLLTVEALVYLSMVRLVWDGGLIEGIKGRLGFHAVVPAAYLVRVPGILVTVAILATTFGSIDAVVAATAARAELAAVGSVARVYFEGRVSPEEADRLAQESGAWLRDEDASGRTVMAVPISLEGRSVSSADILMVNNTYLDLSTVRSTDGRRVTGANPGSVLILVPDGSAVGSEEVEASLLSQSVSDADAPKFVTEAIAPGQSYPMYEQRPDSANPANLTGVPLVVVNSDTTLLRDDDYMAYASQGRILVTESETAVERTPDRFLGAWISAYVPVAQRAADELAERYLALRIQVGTLLVSLGVLIATAIGLGQIHVRGNAQEILVRHLHGWKFVSIHKRLLIAELVIVGVVTAWAAWRYASTVLPGLRDAPSGVRAAEVASVSWLTPAVLIVTVLNLGLLILVVQFRSRSMIRTRSEETA